MHAHALTFQPAQFRRSHEGKTLDKDKRAFQIAINILNVWGFSDPEKAIALGDIPIATFRLMKAGKMPNKLTTDRRTRVSLILGIHKALRILFLQDVHRLEWINNPNRALGEYSPKEVILSGSLVGMNDVRRYLDAARG